MVKVNNINELQNAVNAANSEAVKPSQAKPVQKASKPVRPDSGGGLTINGIDFGDQKPIYDYSQIVALDIPEDVRHNELHHYWVNDVDDNINKYLSMGYRHQPNTSGEEYRQRVGVKKDGTPMFAYLMAVPKRVVEDRLSIQEARSESVLSLDSRVGGTNDASSFLRGDVRVSDTYE